MKAILITKKGGPDVLQFIDMPTPAPAEGEVLIHVKAAGVNRSDIHSRKSNTYGSADPQVPGLEVSGIVTACGPGVSRWHIGDEVCALVAGGGYAEYVVVPAGQCLPVPPGWSLEEAAGLPETVCTVWLNAFRIGGLQKGKNFLVHGGSSGIGTTAIQLATAMGISAYATAGTDEKCRWCESLGAIRAVNYKSQDFEETLKGIGLDVILDMTGGDFTIKNLHLLREDGRLIYISSMRGKDALIDIREVMSKRLVITGSMLKPRDPDFKARLVTEVEEKVWPLIAKGALKPLIYRILPLEQAGEAQQLMESSEHMGKILLRVS